MGCWHQLIVNLLQGNATEDKIIHCTDQSESLNCYWQGWFQTHQKMDFSSQIETQIFLIDMPMCEFNDGKWHQHSLHQLEKYSKFKSS